MYRYSIIGLVAIGLAAIWAPFVLSKVVYEPHGYVLMNLTLHNWADYGSYAAWIEQARVGHLLFSQLNSTELPNPNLFFHPLFFIFGLIARAISVNSYVAILLLRTLGLFLLLYGLSHFLKTLGLHHKDKLWSLWFLFLGSGLGWFFGIYSLDLTQSESSIFFSIFASVLNPISLAFILLIFSLYLRPRKRYSWLYLSSLIVLLGLIHPYDLVSVLLITGMYAAYVYWLDRNLYVFYDWLKVIICVTPVILYQAILFMHSAPLSIWAFFQTNVESPNVMNWVLVYAFFFIFILFWLLTSDKKNTNEKIFLVIWLVGSSLLMFNPITSRFQQKLSLGMFVPMGLLAFFGIKNWLTNISENSGKLARLAGVLLMAIFLATNISLVINTYRQISFNKDLWFLKKTELDGINQLKFGSSSCNSIILASYKTGNRIPGLTGCSVYLGHYDQTVNFQLKYGAVPLLLASHPNGIDPLKFFVERENINYILVDEEIRSHGGLDTTGRPYLKLVYQNPDVEIYQVQ